MSGTLANFPFWILEFDKDGVSQPSVQTLLNELPASGITDLFVFSHGWNNNHAAALDLYTRFFEEVRAVVTDPSVRLRQGVKIGVAGVFWPSILFPGDTPPPSQGGASSFDTAAQTTLDSELPKAFCEQEQQEPLRQILQLLKDRPSNNEALLAFRDNINRITTPPKLTSSQDNSEAIPQMSDDEWLQLLDRSASAIVNEDSEGGAAGMGSAFDKLWNGAANVLRVATYWEMKNRAGVIGRGGLGPLIGKINAIAPQVRIYLLGHSFGARLVSYSLAGIPDGLTGPRSPIKLLFLLQGAFSHFAFCSQLPFDPTRSGDLEGMDQRVDGPLLTTFSSFDKAVGVAYPAASFLSGSDASAFGDMMYRWQGMGSDGAQNPDAAAADLGNVHTQYMFVSGKWLNLDGNGVIKVGGPPSGAHGDIAHPHTAWAALAASRIAEG